MRHFTIATIIVLILSSTAYCADFGQEAIIKTSIPSSPVAVIEEKRHVLCDKCPSITKFNPVVVAQPVSIIMKVGKPKEVKEEPIIVEEKKVLYFPLGKTNPIGGDSIKEIASYVSSIESIAVKGFTCDVGSKELNDKLALKRAEVVSEMLQKLGVSKEKISVEGLGKCCYKLSPAQSRRVEITLKIKKQT